MSVSRLGNLTRKSQVDGLGYIEMYGTGCFQQNTLFHVLINQGGYCYIHFIEREIETQW